ncbi:MAG: phosphoglycerate kinase [Candidatus Woesearchaeota archaeon]
MIKTINNFDFKGKRVLIRVDFNVPLDKKGDILDDFRIKMTLPTINHILKQMPKQVILMTHVGRPKGNIPEDEPNFKTDKITAKLGKLVNMPIRKVDGWDIVTNTSSEKNNDCIIMLENLRFNPAEKSKDQKDRDDFGKQLAGLADIYVNDAFSNCHRDHASMTSVPKFIKGGKKNACIGYLIKKEMDMIKLSIEDPQRPFISLIGGVKADKLNAIENLLKTADKILLGGSLAFLFLKVSGKVVGKTKIDTEGLTQETEKKIRSYLNNPKIVLPTDAVVASNIDDNAKTADSDKEDSNDSDNVNSDEKNSNMPNVVLVDNIPKNKMALDIGPATIKHYSIIIKQAKTIIWNGPMGLFEKTAFANGTKDIAKAISETSAKSIIGGGDSAAAVTRFGYADKMTHISSGGGASLKIFEGKELVALKVLEQ